MRRFTIDRVKTVCFVVSEWPDDPDAAAMTAAIIAMARGQRLSVVAEGVETTAQALLLRQPGCDEVQGDLFGQPSPPEDFKARIRARAVLIDAEHKDDSWDI